MCVNALKVAHCMRVKVVIECLTQKQSRHPTHVCPGYVTGGAKVLHVREIEDDGHKADENEVGSTNDAQEQRCLTKLGASQDQLKEHLFEDTGERFDDRLKSIKHSSRV